MVITRCVLVVLVAMLAAGCTCSRPVGDGAGGQQAGAAGAAGAGMESGAGSTTGSGAPAARKARWHYTFRPSADLATLDTRLCFDGRVPARLAAQNTAARRALTGARMEPGGVPLATDADGVDLSPLAPGECAGLTHDLAAIMESPGERRDVQRHGDDLLLSPDLWLWKPVGGREQAELTASFELPEGVAVAVPWPTAGAGYRIPESTFSWRIYGAMGRYEPVTMSMPGGRLTVAILGDDWAVDRRLLLGWLCHAAAALSRFYGSFPVAEATVIVVPTEGDAVHFGSAAQGGGSSVLLYVGRRVSRATLDDDWVAVHELFHLSLPPVTVRDSWLHEGLATYYEPIIRARAGLTTPHQVWADFHDGFARGASQASSLPLAEDSEKMHETRRYWRVYWAGAAMALLADVHLRQRGKSLDDEVRAMHALAGSSDRMWSSLGLLEAAMPAGSELYAVARAHLGSSEFPAVSAAYRTLGLTFDNDANPTMSADPAATALREGVTGTGTGADATEWAALCSAW